MTAEKDVQVARKKGRGSVNTLLDRRNFDKFEATLRDITGCTLPWGGKIVIFCGDFRLPNLDIINSYCSHRQCLPIIARASRATTVAHTITRSHLWKDIQLSHMDNFTWQLQGKHKLYWTIDQKISRVGRPEDVIFAVKKTETTSSEKFVTKNVVFREVLLHRRRPPPPQVESNPATIPLETDHSSALDYDSIYDDVDEKEEGDDQPRWERVPRRITALPTPSLTACLPSNVTLAPLPTVREAEVSVLQNNSTQLKNHANRLRLTWRVSMLLMKLGWPTCLPQLRLHSHLQSKRGLPCSRGEAAS